MSVDLVSDEDFPTPQFEAPETFDFEGTGTSNWEEEEADVIPVLTPVQRYDICEERIRARNSRSPTPAREEEEETPYVAPRTPDLSDLEEVPIGKHKPATTAGGARQARKKNKSNKK
jgi:hypothetical protein